MSKMMEFILHREGNIPGKGENADSQHFLLYPQSFQKVVFPEQQVELNFFLCECRSYE